MINNFIKEDGMAKKVSATNGVKAGKRKEKYKWPEKLSQAGEWLKAHPNGLDVIYIDRRAVMR
jgi:hypothetical protein